MGCGHDDGKTGGKQGESTLCFSDDVLVNTMQKFASSARCT